MRDKYKRSKDKYDFYVSQNGSEDCVQPSYFMKDQLSFLNPHLIDRKKLAFWDIFISLNFLFVS